MNEDSLMKKFWCTTFLVIVLMTFYSSLIGGQQFPGPRVVFEEMSFDARQVKEGEIIEHSFKFFNRGDSVLRIKNVKPG